jgi:hypothetical protein
MATPFWRERRVEGVAISVAPFGSVVPCVLPEPSADSLERSALHRERDGAERCVRACLSASRPVDETPGQAIVLTGVVDSVGHAQEARSLGLHASHDSMTPDR